MRGQSSRVICVMAAGKGTTEVAATAAGLCAANVQHAHVSVDSKRFCHLQAFVFASSKRANLH